MKQETIEQLMRIAGFNEKCCVALMADQVKAMLEAAYEAGQRDQDDCMREFYNEVAE